MLEEGSIEQLLLTRLSKSEFKKWVDNSSAPYKELMAYYRCAIMAIETKFRILNEELSIQYDRNPIETIKSRLKSPESIFDKITRKGCPLTVESIEENITDIAGVRVICSFPSDIYMLANAFEKQDDIHVITRKDYISNPKPNGYRSLHLIVDTPIFLHDRKRYMKVEVQFRTIAMDWWASTEHKTRYKIDIFESEAIKYELSDCARIAEELDQRMEQLYTITRQSKKM